MYGVSGVYQTSLTRNNYFKLINTEHLFYTLTLILLYIRQKVPRRPPSWYTAREFPPIPNLSYSVHSLMDELSDKEAVGRQQLRLLVLLELFVNKCMKSFQFVKYDIFALFRFKPRSKLSVTSEESQPEDFVCCEHSVQQQTTDIFF